MISMGSCIRLAILDVDILNFFFFFFFFFFFGEEKLFCTLVLVNVLFHLKWNRRISSQWALRSNVSLRRVQCCAFVNLGGSRWLSFS